MAYTKLHSPREFWALVRRQHNVITRTQLLALGFSQAAIHHRIAKGRLVAVYRGVYAVGRAPLTQEGQWIAAVLACGEGAALSHDPAAALAGFRATLSIPIDVSVPIASFRRRPGIRVHRRAQHMDVMLRDNIPVTTVPCTLIDLAGTRMDDGELERAISEAVSMHLTTPNQLLSVLERTAPRPGTGRLRTILTRHSFRLTDSELERIFIPLAIEAGLPVPETRTYVNDHKVDFFWPDLGLVVEADSLTFHADPFQQRNDRLRDQAHAAAGLTQLRFTHWQVYYDRAQVLRVLTAIAERLRPRLEIGS